MLKFILTAVALIFGAVAAHADDTEKAVRDALHTVVPSATPDVVQKSELPGFYEIVIKGQVFFISNDGKYLVQGDVY
ncbi:MAG: disulfide isomerase DsbC N-terminal domain-containing protein, partial [Rudaea sp.]